MFRNLLIFSLLLIGACGGRTAEEHLEYARLKQEKGKLADAVESYRAAAELEPGRADIQVELAEVHLLRRNHESARAACARALEIEPALADAHEARIRSFLAEELYEDAHRAAQGYLGVAADRSRALLALAEVEKERCSALLVDLLEESRSCPDVRDEARILLEIGRGDLKAVCRLFSDWGDSSGLRRLGELAGRAETLRREAVRWAEEAVAVGPDNHAAYLLRGDLLLLSGRPGAAVADLERATSEDAADEVRREALTLLVSAREALGDPEAALGSAKGALELDPDDEVLRLSRALLRIRNGDLEGALRDADSLERRDRASVRDDYVRGVVHMSRGEYQEAHEDLVRATTLPGDPGPHFWLGLALLAQGQRQVGVASLKEALERQPNHAMAHVSLSWATLDGGRASEALDHAERATRIDPGSPAAWNALARACLARAEEFAAEPGRRKKLRLRAEHAVERLSELVPGKGGEGTLALLRLTRGGTEEAVATVLDGLESRPEDPELLGLLGYIHARRGEPKLARAAFEKARRLAPERPEPWLGIAGLDRAAGDLAGAEGTLRELINGMPEAAAARLAIAELVSPEEAREILSDGLRLDPGDGDLHFLRIECLRALDDEEALLEAARETVRQVPGDSRLAQLPLLEIEAARPGEAVRIAAATVDRFPEMLLARAVLAAAHAAAGSATEGVIAAERARDLAEESPWPLLLVIDLNTLAGDVDRARSLAANARILAPAIRERLAASVPAAPVPARTTRGIVARTRAVGWFLTGRWPERAARAASEALSNLPGDPACLEILAVARTQIRDFEGARLACRKLLELDPELLVAHVRIAESFLAEGRKADARRELEKALEKGLSDPRGLFLLARLRTDEGEREEAREAAVLAARGASEDSEALLLLAAFEEDAGDLAAARRTLERAHSIDPEFPGVKAALSRVLSYLGEEGPRAEKLASEAANLTPRRPQTFHSLALARLRAGRPEDALRAIDDAVARRPDDASFRATRGEILLALDRTPQAKEEFLRAEEKGEAGPRVGLALALIAHRRGELDEAARRYEAVLAGGGRSVQAANNLACIYLEKGIHPERAMDLARRAVELGGRTPATLDTLAWAALRNGDPVLAVRLLTEAERKAPGLAGIRSRLEEARSALR